MSRPKAPSAAPSPAPRSAPGRGREERWEIVLPGFHPVRLNQLIGVHWATVQRRKNATSRMLATFSAHVPKATGKRRVTLRITLGPRQRGGDPDAYWKGLLDSAVKLSLLVDDNRKWVELLPVEFERGKTKATTIILEDIES